jgi:hypothetical protein
MATVEVDLIRQLTRTLRRVWLILGPGSALPIGQGSDLTEDVQAALLGAEEYFRAAGLPEDEEDE